MNARLTPAEGHASEIDGIAHEAYLGRDFEWVDSMSERELRELVKEVAGEILDLSKDGEVRCMDATIVLECAIEEWAEREVVSQ